MNYKKLIKRALVRQIDENDCGIASLATIMNLCGLTAKVPLLRNHIYIPSDGLSLLQLRNLAEHQGIKATCVELEIEYLSANHRPCILLTKNKEGDGHFQVCYHVEKTSAGYLYMMADPAVGVHYLGEQQLVEVWPSKAALFFDDFQIIRPTVYDRLSASMLALRVYPKMFLIAIPFLNCCILLFGATTSWMLQKLIDRSIAQTQESLLIIIVVLLLFINLFKNLAGYARQLLLTHFTSDVQAKLITMYADELAVATRDRKSSMTENSIKFILIEIEKINKAITTLIATLMSDGLLTILLLSMIGCTDLISATINLIYIIAACGLTFFKLPQWNNDRLEIGLSYSEAAKQLNGLVAAQVISDETAIPAATDKYKTTYLNYLNSAKNYAGKTSKVALMIECFGTINVLLVFTLQVKSCLHQQTTFGAMLVAVLFSYMITSLLPKICDAMVTVSQGTTALRQFRFNISAQL